jgi:hypothetical protein
LLSGAPCDTASSTFAVDASPMTPKCLGCSITQGSIWWWDFRGIFSLHQNNVWDNSGPPLLAIFIHTE